jgi:hypothetical protein
LDLKVANRKPTRAGSPALGTGTGLKIPCCKKLDCYQMFRRTLDLKVLDKRPKHRKMYMRFGTWNLRKPYRVGLLMTYLVRIQDVRWNREDTEQAEKYIFSMEGGMRIIN